MFYINEFDCYINIIQGHFLKIASSDISEFFRDLDLTDFFINLVVRCNPLMMNSDKNVFTNLKRLINDLQDLGFFTQCDRNYIFEYVRSLKYFHDELKETLKNYVSEFDDQFYNNLFEFGNDTNEIPNISCDDPFYPLLEQTKKILTDLNLFKEAYNVYPHRKELYNNTKLVYVSIVQHRKEFLKDMIGLLCKSYTIKIKDSKTRANLDTGFKIRIDELCKRQIEDQHLQLFVTLNMNIRSTNDYNEMCMCLKILKIPVNDICDLISDTMAGNKINTTELDQFVPGCPTFETPKYQTESIGHNYEHSIQKRSLLSVQETINDTTNINSLGVSLNNTVSLLCLVMLIIMVFKKLFW